MSSLRRSLKRIIGYGSPSPERDETGRIIRRRASSPPPPTQAQLEEQLQQYLARQQEEIARQEQAALLEQLKIQSDHEVNAIIDNINSYLDFIHVNVDNEDPTIRFIVIMIVKSSNAGQNIYERLARSKLLLTAIANVIIKVAKKSGTGILNIVQILSPIITRGAQQSGTFLAERGRTAYGTASTAASTAASTFRGYLISQQREVRAAASPPRQNSYGDMTRNAYNYAATGLATALPIFYNALYSVLTGIYQLLLPCVATGASMVASAASTGLKKLHDMCLTPEQAVSQAVNDALRPLRPLPQEQDLECAICMTAANFVDERGVNYGPLGYVEKHRNGAPGHPDKFHRSCLQGCQDRCPMCRAEGPVWGVQRPPGQGGGGGGSKKYRSKSKSKSKSKSRRYLSKPQKSRKARKRIRHASSRRR